MRLLRNRSGIGLTLLVAVIAILGLILMGAVRSFENTSKMTQLRIDQTKARYLAQAGVMQAVWNWYVSNTGTEASRRYDDNGAGTTVVGNNLFKFGSDGPGGPNILQSNFAYHSFNSFATTAWVTAAANTCTQGGAGTGVNGACRRLRLWRIRNIQTAGLSNIVLAKCRVSWTPAGAEGVSIISLNGTAVQPGGGPFASGTDIDITDTTLAPGAVLSGNTNYIEWSAEPGGAANVAVTVQWTFADEVANPTTVDSKSHEVVFWNGAKPAAGIPTQRTFDVTATGQVNQNVNYFKVSQTTKAVVSGAPGAALLEIVDWDEGDQNIQ